MAKKASPKRAKKQSMQDKKVGTTAGATQRTFPVAQVATGPVAVNAMLAIDRCLNLVNRRLYRQHKVYTAKVHLSNPNETTTPIGVYVLRNTWAVRKSIALAKHIYDKAVREERAVVGNARWHDYRITPSGSFANTEFRTLPLAITSDAEYTALTEGSTADGEYQFSEVEVTTSSGTEQQKGFSLRPSSAFNSYSIFAEYQNMGPSTSESPVFNAVGGYDRATGTSFEDENVQDLLNKGNLPPYNAGDLGLGSPWVKVGEIGRDAQGGMVTSTGFFEAPLGLVWLEGYQAIIADPTSSTGETLPLSTQLCEVEVKMGDYKGVMAHDI